MHEPLCQLFGGLEGLGVQSGCSYHCQRAGVKVFAAAVCCLGISDVNWLETPLIHITIMRTASCFYSRECVGRRLVVTWAGLLKRPQT